MRWCEANGAESIEDVVEAGLVDEFVEALKLKFEEFTGDPAEDAILSCGCIAHKNLNLLLPLPRIIAPNGILISYSV